MLLHVLLAAVMGGAAPAARDCGDVFGFYGAADTARFSPLLPGDDGVVVLTGYLVDPFAARLGRAPLASWEIAIEQPAGAVVRRFHGVERLSPAGPVAVSAAWDGRDELGRLLPEADYVARFRARSGAQDSPFTDGVTVTVDLSLDVAASRALRFDAARAAAAPAALDRPQMNAPHEPIPYSFWYGSPHTHTTRSDGGGSAVGGDCQADPTRPEGSYPDQAFSIGRTQGGLDWMMVAEHNHQLDDADPYDNRAPSGASAIYAQGRAYADAATSAWFVAMYGMEWGEILNCGHVEVYDAPKLFNWESGRYDVYTPYCLFTGAGHLYDLAARAGNTSPADGRPHLVLCHPDDPTAFYSYARDAYADAAVRGVAVVSGSATSCATNFPSGGNGLTGTYKDRFVQLLDAGWKVAPEGHQDVHADNYGTASEVRTVILAPALTRASLLDAQWSRRVYATQDRDGQLIVTARRASATGVHFMGESFGGKGGVHLHVSWWDPDSDRISSYRLLRGKVGGGCAAFSCLTVVASGFTGVPSGPVTIDRNESLASGVYFYLVDIQQPGKLDSFVRHTVSAPIWVDYDAN